MDDLGPAERVKEAVSVALLLALALYPLRQLDQLAGAAHLLELLQQLAHVRVGNAGEVGLLGLDGRRGGREAFGGCEELSAQERIVGVGLVGYESLRQDWLRLL